MKWLEDLLAKLPQWLRSIVDYNRYTCVAIVLITVIVVSASGCLELKSKSPVTGEKLNQEQLVNELQAFVTQKGLEINSISAQIDQAKTQYGTALADIEKKKALIQQGLDSLSALLGPVAGPWSGALTVSLALLTTGLGLDNNRKNKVIEAKKQELVTLTGAAQ